MADKSTVAGFTIVELMVTLAMAAVLMGIAVPAFTDFVRQRTMAARSNEFVLAVTYARSEAVRRGRVVSVQAIGIDADNEWGGGYCVVIGPPSDCSDADDVLRSFAAMDAAEVTFNATGGLDGQGTLRFNARGMLIGVGPGRIELCHVDEDVDPGRVIDLSVTGRADSQELECHV